MNEETLAIDAETFTRYVGQAVASANDVDALVKSLLLPTAVSMIGADLPSFEDVQAWKGGEDRSGGGERSHMQWERLHELVLPTPRRSLLWGVELSREYGRVRITFRIALSSDHGPHEEATDFIEVVRSDDESWAWTYERWRNERDMQPRVRVEQGMEITERPLHHGAAPVVTVHPEDAIKNAFRRLLDAHRLPPPELPDQIEDEASERAADPHNPNWHEAYPPIPQEFAKAAIRTLVLLAALEQAAAPPTPSEA